MIQWIMNKSQQTKRIEPQVKENPSIERVFLTDDLLPNAADAFIGQIETLDKAIGTADIVLDTNVLLLPYRGFLDLENHLGIGGEK